MAGLDHTTAAIELRERLVFAEAEIPAALQRLTASDNPLLEQAAILSTCNRVELYGAARRRPAEPELASYLALYHGLDAIEVASRLYVFRGYEVAHRLAATAAGMHSSVLGEAQIQGQVRKALELALAAGTAGTELRRLFESRSRPVAASVPAPLLPRGQPAFRARVWSSRAVASEPSVSPLCCSSGLVK